MTTSNWIELGIVLVAVTICLVTKIITGRKVKDMDGNVGFIKKDDSKGRMGR